MWSKNIKSTYIMQWQILLYIWSTVDLSWRKVQTYVAWRSKADSESYTDTSMVIEFSVCLPQYHSTHKLLLVEQIPLYPWAFSETLCTVSVCSRQLVHFLFMWVLQTHKQGHHSWARPPHSFDVTTTRPRLFFYFWMCLSGKPRRTYWEINEHASFTNINILTVSHTVI